MSAPVRFFLAPYRTEKRTSGRINKYVRPRPPRRIDRGQIARVCMGSCVGKQLYAWACGRMNT
eukprot:366475-Chlamydomonas_euryale.AAC.3